MAKSTTKPTSAAPKKAAAKSPDLLKVAETALQKMEALNISQQLQSEIQWCIGSYKHDQNPIGLHEKLSEALPVIKAELAKKTKGITAKLIGDIEKALGA